MPYWKRGVFVLAAISVWGVAVWALAAPVRVLDPAETNARFPKAQVTTDAREGKGAWVVTLPPGKTSFLQVNIRDGSIDLSKYPGLAFWWKVEGEGLKSLSVKTRHPSMSEGRQYVLPVWRAGKSPAPTEWTAATVMFSRNSGMQGNPSPTSSLEFRVQVNKGADLKLYIDQLVGLPGAFDLTTDRVRFEGGEGSVGVGLKSEATEDLDLLVGVGDKETKRLALGAGKDMALDLPLPLSANALKDLKPLERISLKVWVQIGDAEITRATRLVHAYKPIPLPPRPRLMVDAAQVAEMKERIERYDWAKSRWENLKKSADAALKRELDVPPGGGGQASHYYANPKTGGRLTIGKKIGKYQWEHVDKKTGEVFTGDPSSEKTDFDLVAIHKEHSRNSWRARSLAIAYQISGDKRYAEKAREIVVAYGRKYKTFPQDRYGTGKTHGVGRATANYLTESSWVITMAGVIDMIWDVLSEDERRMLADDMLYVALRDSIRPVRCGVHNIQCWKNSAKIYVGLLYEDPELIYSALHDPVEGYWRQLEKGVLPGGVWYEGSWGYHFYTMMALVPLTEAARHCGIDLYADPLKEMFLAPTRFAMPDMRLPNFNDAGLMDLKKSGNRYFVANARWPELEEFKSMTAYGKKDAWERLLDGTAATLPEKKGLPFATANHKGAGYATLVRGEGADATWLTLKYSPSSGYHDHPDRNHFILYARGQLVAIDTGSVSYGMDIQRDWYKTTLSHNTLTVDEKSQLRKDGKFVAFGSEKGVDYAMVDDNEAIPEVRFVRTVALVDKDLIVFIDQVRADAKHTLDFAYHQAGEWVKLPAGNPARPPQEGPYTYLRDPTQREATKGLTVSTRVADGFEPSVTVAPGDVATYALTSTGPGIGSATSQVPCLILRREAQNTVLAWAIALDGQAPELRVEPVRAKGGQAVETSQAAALRVEWHGKKMTLVANPDGLDLEGSGKAAFVVGE